jgi:hypothetical protein
VSTGLRRGSYFGRSKMAVAYTKPWDTAIEKNIRDFYHTLSDKDRRRFAAGAGAAVRLWRRKVYGRGGGVLAANH